MKDPVWLLALLLLGAVSGMVGAVSGFVNLAHPRTTKGGAVYAFLGMIASAWMCCLLFAAFLRSV